MDNIKLAEQAVAKGYVGSVQEYLDAEAKGRSTTPVSSIPAKDIQPTTPVSVPNPVNNSSAQTIDQITAETNAQTRRAEQEFQSSKKTFEQRIQDATNVMGSRDALEDQQGLGQARLDTADIRNQIEARELSLRRAIENTQKTAGLSGTQIARQVQALNRDAARELADLSIVESARLRRLDAIETNIDRKIKSQLEPLQFQLQFDQMFYQENRAAMTSAQDRSFQLKIAAEERNYQEKVKERESIKTIALNAAQFGASPEEIVAITNANGSLDAILKAGTILAKPFNMQVQAQEFSQNMQAQELELAKQVAQANISNIYSQMKERQSAALLAQAQEAQTKQDEKEAAAEQNLGLQSLLKELESSKGMSSAVGFGAKKSRIARAGTGATGGAAAGALLGPVGAIVGGVAGGLVGAFGFGSEASDGSARADFEIKAGRLSDMFLTENLDKMTGTLTDKDLEVLRNEGTTIGNFNQSEDSWKKEHARLMNMVERGLKENGITEEQSQFWYGLTESDIDSVDIIYSPNSTQSFAPSNYFK